MEEDGGMGRAELLANVQRLTRIVLNRLEKGSQEGTLDTGQVRMLGSIALRALRLWKEALGRDGVKEKSLQRLRETEAGLAGRLSGSQDQGETARKPVDSEEGDGEA